MIELIELNKNNKKINKIINSKGHERKISKKIFIRRKISINDSLIL